MWIINDDGFFSAVEDWDNSDWVYVRSRSETDLQAFISIVESLEELSDWTAEVLSTPHRDYQWRVHTPRQVWAQYLMAKANSIDYGNFKHHCAQQWRNHDRDYVPERLSVLNDAWMLFNHWPNGEL